MTIYPTTQQALETLGLPVAAVRFIPADGGPLPDEYLVHKMVSNVPTQHADDEEVAHTYRVQVSYFNRAGLDNPPDIDGAMKAAGFTRSQSVEIPYNESTRHFGLATDYFFLEEN